MAKTSATHKDSIIHMLRTMQQHHVQLSIMADQKAGFLMAASFIVLSMLIAYVSQGVCSWTIGFTILFLLLTLIFAVFAVTPRQKGNKQIGTDDNMLFFGNFSELSFDGFIKIMKIKMQTEDTVHQAMLQDVYAMGKVLNEKKFKYLTISYRIFLAGIIIAPIIAIIEYGKLI